VSKRQTERRHASIPHATMYDKGRDDADDKLHLDHDATPRHGLPPSPCNNNSRSAFFRKSEDLSSAVHVSPGGELD
jgi:hypothetical protein